MPKIPPAILREARRQILNEIKKFTFGQKTRTLPKEHFVDTIRQWQSLLTTGRRLPTIADQLGLKSEAVKRLEEIRRKLRLK